MDNKTAEFIKMHREIVLILSDLSLKQLNFILSVMKGILKEKQEKEKEGEVIPCPKD